MKNEKSKLVRRAGCPSCHSSGRDKHADNLAVYDDGHSFCFRCNHYIPPAGREALDAKCTYEFLPWRGVTADAFRVYNVLTKVDPEGRPTSLGFTYPNGDVKVRLLDDKLFYYNKNSTEPGGLFGRDRFAAGSHKYVVITEGELDAISYHQCLGKVPVVSVSSASSAYRDCSFDREYLNSFDRIYLAFDNDAAGREAMATVSKLFDYDKTFHVRFSNRKDANDYLRSGEVTELYNIWANAKKYLPESLASSFAEFDKIISEEPKWGIPYPFPTLTEMTYGIRTGESVLITAQEGVGKTELMHAIEYQVLKETDHNVGAIFLEELPQRHLQALAGIHLKAPVHLPDSGFTKDQVRTALRELIRKDERLHVHLHFGTDDPDVLLDDIRFLVTARGCRVVLFDHVSLAASGLSEQDERRFLDRFVTKVEMMVKSLDFAFIMVSHVNDNHQTRGSRYIGKIADTRIDATRDLLSSDDVVRNTTRLVISKNRYGMQTGFAGNIVFDPLTYTMREAANDNGEGNAIANKNRPRTQEMVQAA